MNYRKRRSVPRLNMASMPDLIFTVLFFFMTITHMRTETPRLSVTTPEGKELTQPASRREIINLYIGNTPNGETKVQVGNNILRPEDIGAALRYEAAKAQADAATTIVNIRCDKHAPMGVVNNVKQELRKCGFLNIRYNATEKK